MLDPQMSRGSILPLGPIWVMDITPDAIISALIVEIVLNLSIFDHQSHFADVSFQCISGIDWYQLICMVHSHFQL